MKSEHKELDNDFCVHKKTAGPPWNGYIECPIKAPKGIVRDSICIKCGEKDNG